MTSEKPKKQFSIKFSLSITFSLVVLTTSVFICLVFFYEMRKSMRDEIAIRIHDIAAIASHEIDVNMHASLTNPSQENSADYKKIKTTLQQIRNGGTGIRFVYTVRRLTKGDYIFVVDGEEDPKLVSHLGDVFNSVDLEVAYNSPDKIWIREAFYTDQWGTWMSGFIKLYNSSGQLDGFLGIDVSAVYILDREREIFFHIGIMILVIVILFLVIGIFLAAEISKPLQILEKDMLEIKELRLDSSLQIKTIFREIISMKDAEDNMKSGLRSFKKYIPADLVNQLLLNNIEADLGGEKKELTIFFSDIENFTTISETMEPERIAIYMNDYFEGLTSIILKHHGTVDKFIGDAIMAFWGAPIEMEDHAYRATLAALECQEFLLQFNQKSKEAGRPVFITRIGISTGVVVVGNFGYKDRMNYTVFGDHVNLANRLEGLNKHYNTSIILNESSYLKVADKTLCRKLDLVSVKGKTNGVFIYELVGLKDSVSPKQTEFVTLFNEGMDHYFQRQWEEALQSFSAAEKIMPDDYCVIQMILRCKNHRNNPPPANWNGITTLTEK